MTERPSFWRIPRDYETIKDTRSSFNTNVSPTKSVSFQVPIVFENETVSLVYFVYFLNASFKYIF